MKHLKSFVLLPGVILTALLALVLSGAAQAGWEPKKPVDFVIMAGKGGGADKMARLLQSVIEKHALAEFPFVYP